MPAFPRSLGARKIRAIVAAARFLPEQRRLDDEVSRLKHVELFRGTGRKSRADFGEALERVSEAARGARDAGVLPHHGSNGVRRNLRGAAIRQRRHFPFLNRWGATQSLDRRKVASDAFSKH
jgi:hypothetical protein